MTKYLRRTLDATLDTLLPLAPAIAIDGPKGVGKTGTAQRRARSSWFLDLAEFRALAEADPYFRSVPAGTFLLDEWQRVPQTWDVVRRQVDAGAPAGRFLLTGSASPARGVDTHSGAGRILSLRMRPMALHERGCVQPTVSLGQLMVGEQEPLGGETDFTLVDYAAAIVSSGFPGIMLSPEGLRKRQLDAYLLRVIDRDMPDQGLAVRRPDTLRRWLRAYAAASSTTASYSNILDAATAGDGSQPAKSTTIEYRDMLTKLWLIDSVPGWTASLSTLKLATQAPKHQLADPALAARLLGLSAGRLLNGHPMLGPLFESLACLTFQVSAAALEAKLFHLRTKAGRQEVDLILEGEDGRVVAAEVKLAATPTASDGRHLRWLAQAAPDRVADSIIITTGTRAYRRPDGIGVVPLALLGP